MTSQYFHWSHEKFTNSYKISFFVFFLFLISYGVRCSCLSSYYYYYVCVFIYLHLYIFIFMFISLGYGFFCFFIIPAFFAQCNIYGLFLNKKKIIEMPSHSTTGRNVYLIETQQSSYKYLFYLL